MLVLGYSESELNSVCLVGFLTFERKVLKIFKIFCQPSGPVGKPNHPVHLVQFAGLAVWVV